MAETEPQVDAPQETEDAAPKAKKTTRKRPAKKRAAKKPAKKTVKKTRATKKKDESDNTKTAVAKKQPAKKRSAKKSRSKAKDEGRTVISSPPSKRREAQKAAAEADQAVAEEKTQQSAQEEAPENKQAEEATAMQWGRRSKRSGPISWEDHAGSGSTPAQPARRSDSSASEQPAEAEASAPAEEPKEAPVEAKAEETPVAESSAPAEEPKEAPTESRGGQQRSNTRKPSSRSDRNRNRGRNDKNDQDNRRSSRNNNDRGRSNRSRNEKSDQDNRRSSQQSNNRNRGRQRDEKPDSGQPSRTLAEVLAQSWTEDKTRRFLSDGFLSSLSPELTRNSKGEPIPDAEALKEPLQMIRKVLADECMVADDVTDLMLLDVVMNALSDRIEVCRLQAESTALEDMDVILDLRYKADRRLIEAVNALKNA